MADKSAALRWLISHGLVSTETVDYRQPLAVVVDSRWGMVDHRWDDLVRQMPGAKPWIDALAELKTNAAAPLPTVPAATR